METKTLFVQLSTPTTDLAYIITGAPSDGEDQVRAIQPGIPVRSTDRRIHATEAQEYLRVWNSDEAMNDGEPTDDIRRVARAHDVDFVEFEWPEGLDAIRRRWELCARLYFRSRPRGENPGVPFFGVRSEEDEIGVNPRSVSVSCDMETLTEKFARIDAQKSQGNWIPACGGTEVPFVTRSGAILQYLYQPSTGNHAYINTQTDLILTDEEAWNLLGR